MYDSKIISAEAYSAGREDGLLSLRNMIATLVQCAEATAPLAAVREGPSSHVGAMMHRYAQAGPIVRRRVDAMVREAGIESFAGCRLISSRSDHGAPGTTAAAIFLHRRMATALDRIDRLLPLAA